MPAGRPPIFTDPIELEKLCDNYFKEGGKPTVTGLTLFLGFCDKTSLYDYRDKPEFSHSIKKALTKIEQYHEEGLTENSVAGRIFALKNMGWKDKVETGFTDSKGNDQPIQIIQLPSNGRDNSTNK